MWRDPRVDCREVDRRRGEGGDCVGKCLWRKARPPWKQGDTAESLVGSGVITIGFLPPTHQHPQLNNKEVGPWNA